MSASTSIPATIRIRRSRLAGLIALAAALAAGITWIVLAVAFDGGTPNGVSSVEPRAARSQPSSMQRAIMSLTPAEMAAGALAIGYQLPTGRHGPTVASVLASMDPQTRRYTKAVMNLTYAQLAAGAAGQP